MQPQRRRDAEFGREKHTEESFSAFSAASSASGRLGGCILMEPFPPQVDPGCLPAWGAGDLPEPKAISFHWRNWLSLIGPGLVLAGGSIGTGEWVMGPKIAALYHGAFMWAVLCSIVGQVLFNTE